MALEKIGLEAIFETSRFNQAMKAYFDTIGTAEDVTDNLADALTRLGYDFSGLESDVARTAQKMRASTPENLKYAQSYDRIVKEFKEGKITAQQAADQLDKLQREMKETSQATETATDRTKLFWTELNSMIMIAKQVVSAVARMATEVYEFGKAGAEIEWVNTRLDRLALTIGTTGDALRDDIGTAMQGLVSDADAAAQATDLISLGLVNSHDQAVRMTRAVTLLGADMNQVVLTLTNQTNKRFDQIGIAVDGFDERLEALKAQGYDTNSAFTEAFLQQAEAQLEKVGSIAEENIGTFMRFEASWTNLMNTFKSGSVGPVASVLNKLTQFLTLENLLQKAVAEGRMTMLEANAAMVKYGWTTDTLTAGVKKFAEEEAAANKVETSAIDTAEMLARKRRQLTEDTEKAAIKELDMKEAQDALKRAQELGIITTHDLAISQALLEAGLIDTEEALTFNEESLLDLIDAEEDQLEAEKKLIEATKIAEEEQKKLAEATAAAAKAARDAQIAFFDLAEQLSAEVTATDLAKIAIDQLDKALQAGTITLDEHDTAVREVGLTYDVFTEAGLTNAEMMGIWERIVDDGVIPAENLNEALGVLIKAAEDGTITFDEAGQAIAEAGLLSERSAEAVKASEAIMNQLDLNPAIEEARKLADPLLAITSVPDYQKKVIEVFTTNYMKNVSQSGGSVYGFGGYAAGGPISAGQAAIVGDGGRPEVFVPGSDGFIFPSISAFRNAMSGFGNQSNTNNFNLNMNIGNANAQTVQRSFEMMKLLSR